MRKQKDIRPELFMRQSDYAAARGVTKQAVHGRVAAGDIVLTEEGLVDVEQADDATGWEPLDDDGLPTLADSTRRKEYWISRLRELEFMREAGDLALVDDIRREQFAVARELRDAVERIPNRICHELAAERDPIKVAALLEAAHREALTAIAASLEAPELASE